MSVKVRFAPSPTGFLHVGNIRIALLNYLFAKKHHGSFVLRIDDTDKERSTIESENLIIEDLKWLGISWNEFYKQSNHIEQYNQAIEYLKSIGRIYPCYETKEELDLKRKVMSSRGVPPVYDRASLQLSDAQKQQLEESGIKPYWRFKLNEQSVVEWNDLVHGKISIPLNSISDPVLIKPDGSYVYTFASVVDDVNIGISHIIRGDDHVTNTAAQIDIFMALSGKSPEFAHVPLLSALDGQDVSKRTGSSLSIVNMRNEGIDPQAITNLLATLGTSNNTNHQATIDDLIEQFSFDKMSLSSPKFNIADVRLLTKKIVADKSFAQVKEYMQNADFFTEEFWDSIKNNIQSLKEIDTWRDILFHDINIIKEDAVFVQQMLDCLSPSVDFHSWIDSLKSISGRKGKDLFHPIRVVLTGLDRGPELEKIFALLGHEKVQQRIVTNLKAQ